MKVVTGAGYRLAMGSRSGDGTEGAGDDVPRTYRPSLLTILPRSDILSTKQTAQYLGLSENRVRVLLLNKRIKAVKIGQTWAVYKSDLERFAVIPRVGGRPKISIDKLR
jgi:excisionase family DNA binding protein